MMMDPSILFAGVQFDKKRFAADFRKFRRKDDEMSGLKLKDGPDKLFKSVGNGAAVDTVSILNETPSTSTKKRKRDLEENIEGFASTDATWVHASSGKVSARNKKKKHQQRLSAEEPINLFKPLQSPTDLVSAETSKDLKLQQRQQEARKAEFAGLLRKQHRIHVAGHNVPAPLSSFEELRSVYGCKSYLMKNIMEAGFKEPTPIQRQAISALLSGRECFACAPTGSGKTLAFVLPILMKLKAPSKDGIRAVILCPTRELAKQITSECKILARGRKFRIRLMTKALSRCADFKELPCDVLVSTPLRLDYVLSQSRIDLSPVEYLVLDESDKLFELGFVEQIDAVVNACTNPQILRSLFSATLPDAVEELARSIMHDAVRIVVGEKNSASQTIKQKLLFVGSEEGKTLALRQIFQERLQPPVLLFVQSKERAKELYKELVFEDVKVDCIHADLTQAQRERAVERFREGKTWVLIATDLLARGMDFKGVNYVINFDFPSTTASYIHRIGRSGRAGRLGEAVTFYTEDDVPFLRSVVNVIVASGCEVPSWMLSLPKQKKKRHNPHRKPISVHPGRKRNSSKVSKLSAKSLAA